MQPITFPEANRTFVKPEGWTEEDCRPLPIQDTGEALVSCWQPDEFERARLAAGAPVRLTVYGRGHPPVMLAVPEEFTSVDLPPPEVTLTITGIDGSSLAGFVAKHPNAIAEALRRLVMRGDGTERVDLALDR
jgi:hypothetical protein